MYCTVKENFTFLVFYAALFYNFNIQNLVDTGIFGLGTVSGAGSGMINKVGSVPDVHIYT
jgi:hypothetical protein